MTRTEILIAGHGGQGILLLGDYIAYSSMLEGNHVVYTPSYGPETRGGKTKCYVIISDHIIDSPIADEPDMLIVMNQPSMDFEPLLKPGGFFIYNSSLIDRKPMRSDIREVRVPATEIADGLKGEATDLPPEVKETSIASNAVMFGAYLALLNRHAADDHINAVLRHFLTGRKEKLIVLNLLAIKKGMNCVAEKNTALTE